MSMTKNRLAVAMLNAAQLLRDGGWCAGLLKNIKGQRCIRGAFYEATGYALDLLESKTLMNNEQVLQARMMERALCMFVKTDSVPTWNDCECKSGEEAVTKIEGCAGWVLTGAFDQVMEQMELAEAEHQARMAERKRRREEMRAQSIVTFDGIDGLVELFGDIVITFELSNAAVKSLAGKIVEKVAMEAVAKMVAETNDDPFKDVPKVAAKKVWLDLPVVFSFGEMDTWTKNIINVGQMSDATFKESLKKHLTMQH